MENVEEEKEKSIIKHIVISGGGATGFSYYGVLKQAHNQGIWNIDNILTIYGTSVGALIAVVLSLKYDWETLDDFLIKRPWTNVYKFNMYSIIDSYHKRGIFDIKSMEETLAPLFKGKDISLDITMKELYDFTNIELHIFASELNSYKLVDFSYKTHPGWRVIDVAYCSACLPVMFSPCLKDNNCYCDGGLISNYPLESCINNGIDPNEILGIRRTNKKHGTNPLLLTLSSSLLDYIMVIITVIINNYSKKMLVLNNACNIKKEYVVESEQTTLVTMYSVLNNQEERMNLINLGVDMVKNDH
jgi:predicted acylesterase/phospholipase RssA